MLLSMNILIKKADLRLVISQRSDYKCILYRVLRGDGHSKA